MTKGFVHIGECSADDKLLVIGCTFMERGGSLYRLLKLHFCCKKE